MVRANHDAEVTTSVSLVSTILRLIQQADEGQRFKWEEWGPHGARLMDSSTDLLLDVKVFGSTAMILSWVKGEDSPWQLTLLDFGRLGAKKYMAEVADTPEGDAVELASHQAYGHSELFQSNDLMTFLPARVFKITPDFGEHKTLTLSKVCLGDDCIAQGFYVSG